MSAEALPRSIAAGNATADSDTITTASTDNRDKEGSTSDIYSDNPPSMRTPPLPGSLTNLPGPPPTHVDKVDVRDAVLNIVIYPDYDCCPEDHSYICPRAKQLRKRGAPNKKNQVAHINKGGPIYVIYNLAALHKVPESGKGYDDKVETCTIR